MKYFREIFLKKILPLFDHRGKRVKNVEFLRIV